MTYWRFAQEAVKEKGMTSSMSRKGTPADHALIESLALYIHSSNECDHFFRRAAA
ncbi:hypothetical protein J23TS9_54820 [Paenibacillus sp. J23TS9]|nr:hypothetical protein J23TS9_54820 [Paenibacillus sp. J23TS9]